MPGWRAWRGGLPSATDHKPYTSGTSAQGEITRALPATLFAALRMAVEHRSHGGIAASWNCFDLLAKPAHVSVVKDIAESHKGTSTVRIEIGKGSVFTLVLPAVRR